MILGIAVAMMVLSRAMTKVVRQRPTERMASLKPLRYLESSSGAVDSSLSSEVAMASVGVFSLGGGLVSVFVGGEGVWPWSCVSLGADLLSRLFFGCSSFESSSPDVRVSSVRGRVVPVPTVS